MSEFTSERLAELKAVAEAATEGSWRESGSLFQVAETGNGVGQVWGLNWRSDLAHVAMFDPLTVLSLIAALEVKTAEAEGLRDDLAAWMRSCQKARLRRDEARAEAAEDALERVQSTFFNNGLYLRIVSIPALNNEVGEVLYDRIRAQISKAIRRGRD